MSSSWENYRKESPIQGTNGFWGGTGGGLVGGGGGEQKENTDWASLTTGQSYMNGKIYRDNGNNMMYLYYYGAGRTQQTSTTISALSTNFTAQAQDQIKMYCVGGGGG